MSDSTLLVDQVIWHGTEQEASRLLAALNRNCTCEYNSAGAKSKICPGHKMLRDEQRALDGLLFMRINVEILKHEEGLI